METTKIPMIMALFTLYDIRNVVRIPPQNTPIHNYLSYLG